VTAPLVSAVREALRAAGGAAAAPDWLAPQVACDIAVEGLTAIEAEARAREAVGDAPVDLFAQNPASRRKKLLIADMDSTMITVECLDELADFAGKKVEITAITERAMRGELEFEGALRERVAMLKGLDETALAATLTDRIALTPGARALVQTMNGAGALTILVSGGFTYFTSRIAQAIGFAEHRGNRLVIKDGKLTGEVEAPILGRDAKLASLTAARRRMGLEESETLAVGDGANDLAMLQAAGLGVAFHAKPIVAEAAHARVNHGDLTALLYFQGYRKSEFKDD
jgi:phosphoserine phosphatase